MNRSVPFPQANDMTKVFKLISLEEEYFKDNELIRKYIDVGSDRQVSYYLSALMYLEILGKDKRYTPIGMKLHSMTTKMRIVEVVNILLEDPVIRYAYSYQEVFGVPANEEIIEKMICELYPNYSDAIYERRSSTVFSWVEWMVSI